MPAYDFVEIGTSDHKTEIQKAESKHYGISVEPVKYYLDKLPNKKNCIKVNKAISNVNRMTDVFWIRPEVIKRYNLPKAFQGCNAINEYHKQVVKILKKRELSPEEIIEKEQVEVWTFQKLCETYEVHKIDFLKIDTEGHDVIILEDVLKHIAKTNIHIGKIQFECNILTPREKVDETIQALFKVGYSLKLKNKFDCVMEKMSQTKVKPESLDFSRSHKEDI